MKLKNILGWKEHSTNTRLPSNLCAIAVLVANISSIRKFLPRITPPLLNEAKLDNDNNTIPRGL